MVPFWPKSAFGMPLGDAGERHVLKRTLHHNFPIYATRCVKRHPESKQLHCSTAISINLRWCL
jgi:hypothetical protein